MGNISGGERQFIPSLVRAAAAVGIDALFMEIHNDPKNAKSDPNTVINVKYIKNVLIQAKAMHEQRLALISKLGVDNVE
jgi:2-dehydro-3-deoxyphosphooctonate aldolase (KDO 8-P synthase)